MDIQKDIYKGHTSIHKNAREIRPYKGLLPSVVGKEDGDMSFIRSKTEKLTTAIYMITDFLDSKEPVKWKMRDAAIAVMSFINSFSVSDLSHWKEVPHSRIPVFNAIKDMMSLLEFSSHISLVSEMNASILKKEYASIYGGIESRLEKGDPVGLPVLPERFFDESGSKMRGKRQFRAASATEKMGKNVNANGVDTNVSPAAQNPGAEQHSHQATVAPAAVAFAAPAKATAALDSGVSVESLESPEKFVAQGYNPRRDVILNLLRAKKEIDIKDITNVILNCSEKTVQRELSALVGDGLIKKIGEKRWSKYTIVQ